MTTPPRPTAVETIRCDVCMKEIPQSAATNAEVQDYVMHFCGLECYGQWHTEAEQKEAEQKEQSSKPK